MCFVESSSKNCYLNFFKLDFPNYLTDGTLFIKNRGNLLLAYVLVSANHGLGKSVLKDVLYIEHSLVITLHSTMNICY